MEGVCVVSAATPAERSCFGLLLNSDVIQVADGTFYGDELVGLRRRTDCKLLLGLGNGSGQCGVDLGTYRGARYHRLKTVSPIFDYVELDADSDLVDDILELVPPQKRLITWRCHRFDAQFASLRLNPCAAEVPETTGSDCSALVEHFKNISQVDAFLYRFIAPTGIIALEFLHAVRRANINARKVAAYAEGPEEIWSRIAAACMGAKFVFADSVRNGPAALEALVRQFGLPDLPDIEKFYGISGDSITGSLSPAVHNAAFRQLGHPALYLPFPAKTLDTLLSLVARLSRIGLVISGLTMTAPLKEAASRRFAATRGIVDRARSANVLRLKQDQGWADTTDDLGLRAILEGHEIRVKGLRVAVIGCGGSGRVAADTLTRLGARVGMYNRSRWRAKLASGLLNIRCRPLGEFEPGDADVIVNTIPISVSPGGDLPFSLTGLKRESVVIDYSYGPAANALVTKALIQGVTVIDGLVMLEKQLSAQFKRLTGNDIPPGIIDSVLRDYRDRSAAIPEPCDHLAQTEKVKINVRINARKTNAASSPQDEGNDFLVPKLATGQ